MFEYAQPESLKGITITSVMVKDEKHFAFVGQRFVNTDAWRDVLTYAIFYHMDKPKEERWIIHELDYMTDANGLQGVWCEKPEPCWIFGYTNTGYMVIFNEAGEPVGTEQIEKQPFKNTVLKASFLQISAINNGFAYAVRRRRTAWKREIQGKWSFLNSGIPKLDYQNRESKDWDLRSQHGFRAISGFSDNDLYACGGDGDLWHYNGGNWSQKELPTNAALDDICCGFDGRVYIITNMETIIVGQKNQWKVIKQDTGARLGRPVWYQDRCLVSASTGLYEIKDDKFIESPLAKDIPNLPTHIDARGNILLTASKHFSEQNEVSYYDGEKWSKVLYRKRPPKDPNEPSLLDLIKAYEKKHGK